MTEDAQRLQTLFAAAIELSPDLRAAMLARECASDPQLLAELEALLEADSRFCGTTAQPFASGLTQLMSSLAPQAKLIGMRVGPYELCEEIGRGGMGAVYRAERVDGSVEQHVAIKFVRRELLDANTLKRFQFERQVMAALNHPFIARLLDAAQLDDGTPYYVMEFVDGVSITDYCEQARLDARERVALMRKVCGAVAEAHRELIVHRDLKPSNILVDAAGNPKLLDFGIAKPLSASIEGNEETGTGYRCFSPQYAAPEQLGGAPVGVACDVYGLGLLLYELLAGCRPFDLSGLSAGQIERLIKDVPPAAPSNALARSGTANIRVRQLRGDLDGIVMRCLRKLPSERYASVEQLEADLRNYLEGRPVQARGGHGWYRAQKFMTRNKVAVAAAALVLLSMLVGIVAFAWQARIAQQRAAELEQVAKFQADMLGQVDTTKAGMLLSDDVRAKLDAALRKAGATDSERVAQTEAFARLWQHVNTTDAALDLIDNTILKPAVAAVDKQFKHQPVVDAALSQVLAQRYIDLGLFDAAQPLQERALATRRRVLGDDHPDTLRSLSTRGDLLMAQGKLVEAEGVFREVMEKRRRILGEEHPDVLSSILNMGFLLLVQGKPDEAEPYFREALEKSRRVLGDQHRETLRSLNGMGVVLWKEHKLSEAEPYLRDALDKRRRFLGEEDDDTLSSLNNVSLLLKEEGKLSEAEPYVREVLEKSRRTLGEDHPDVLFSILNMGSQLLTQGKPDEAEPYFREALEKSRRMLGDENPTTLASLSDMGLVLQAKGKLAEAEPYLHEALEKNRRLFGEQDRSTLVSIRDMASLMVDQGKAGEALALLVPAETAMRKEFTGARSTAPNAEAYYLARYLTSLGMARTALGQYSNAEANLIEASGILAASSYPNDLRDCTHALVELYTAWNKAQPGKGYDAKAAEWTPKVTELQSAENVGK